MNAHNGSRFRLAAILAPIVALALASFWVVEVMRRSSDEIIARPERMEPDFYVDQFNYVKMTRTGSAQYHISGARLTHNPQDDSYDIERPVLRSFRSNAEPMVIRSKRAWVNSDNSEVHMFGDVHMDRPATPVRERLQLFSEQVVVLPDDDAMKSDKPVTITFGESMLKGTGMFANNATGEFQLHNNVHGTYQAPPR